MADNQTNARSSENEQVTDSLSNLSIKTQDAKTNKPAKKPRKVVADSWDDESLSSDNETEDATQAPLSTTTTSSASIPNAPPPTPISPVTTNTSVSSNTQSSHASASNTPERRPEKTDAVARRMIAAGLGLKAPKRTEEQREYEKSVREQEKKKREHEKLAEQRRKEEAERAKAAIWDD